jgi:AhpD family alkylhydroperoxidase
MRAATANGRPARGVDLRRDAPEAWRALAALTRAGTIESRLEALVKVRVSQLNGCARCRDRHTDHALDAGEDEARLIDLSRWRRSPVFDERERAALALAEALTLIADGPLPGQVRREAARHFDGPELAALVVAITAINAWNRATIAAAP